jgi:uncharacterized protein (TIGR02145 family)
MKRKNRIWIYSYIIGLVLIFTTDCKKDEPSGKAPSCLTQPATNVSSIGATLNGTVNANDLSTTVRFEYGTTTSYGSTATATQSPVTGNTHTNVAAEITGLTSETTYHFTTKAINAIGITNGVDLTFTTTSSTSVTDVDGNNYNTVTIGTQVWMKENLKTTKYNDNTTIPLVTDNTIWTALTTPGYCWYNNDATGYKATYGALYNWYAVDAASNGGKNICPTDWHVPTDAEWTTLTTYLGGESVTGGKLKSTGTIEGGDGLWFSPNYGATNETGFTALPGGHRNFDGTFSGNGYSGHWWSSTEYSSTNAFGQFIGCSYSDVFRLNYSEQSGFSVRCLRD